MWPVPTPILRYGSHADINCKIISGRRGRRPVDYELRITNCALNLSLNRADHYTFSKVFLDERIYTQYQVLQASS